MSSGLQHHQAETKQAIIQHAAYNDNLGETVTVLKHALASGVAGGVGAVGGMGSVPASPLHRGEGGGGGSVGAGGSRFTTPVKGGMGLGGLSAAAEQFLHR